MQLLNIFVIIGVRCIFKIIARDGIYFNFFVIVYGPEILVLLHLILLKYGIGAKLYQILIRSCVMADMANLFYVVACYTSLMILRISQLCRKSYTW